MTLKNEQIELNGETTGIIVQRKNANGNKMKFITLDGKARLFNNLEVAKIMANVICEGEEFSYWILFDTIDNIINIEQCMYNRRTHTYQYISGNTVYNIKEKRTHKLSNLGYLIFMDGDVQRVDRERGPAIQRELVDTIKETCSAILGEKIEDCGITLIESRKKEIILHLKNTTAKIHILFNSRLMDINQAKSLIPGKKRIPFLKQMDKFVTFYIFSSKDIGEGLRVGGDEKAAYIIKAILDDLKENYPEKNPRHEKILYNGFLDLED